MSIHTLPVYVPFETLEALGKFTGNWWSDTYALEPFVIEAIGSYIKAPTAEQEPVAEQQPAAPSEAGYQWKQVFLPEGTRLRACFGKQPYYARVEGAQIKYGEHAVSPSCFANLHGSGNRNAWKAIWLRFPGSEEWLLADVCRSARKAAIARLLGDAVQADGARQAKAHQADRLPRSAPAAKKGGGTQHSFGRAGRRKRRSSKHHPGNP